MSAEVTVLIYSEFYDPKLDYSFDFIFKHHFAWTYNICTDAESFLNTEADIKISYGANFTHEGLSIPCSSYFNRFDLHREPEFELRLSFHKRTCEFDFIAAVFFLLARVEEYRDNKRDEHNRFKIEDAGLFKKGVIKHPVINYWLDALKEEIERVYGIKPNDEKNYRFLSTLDIDHIYAYRNKPLFLQTLSLGKDLMRLAFNRIRDRLKTKDPYDSYDQIIQWHKDLGIDAIVFMLCSQRGKYDKNLNPDSESFQEVSRQLDTFFELAWHPSYASSGRLAHLRKEKMILESVLSRPIEKSRQHYLRFVLPDYYRALIEAGITEEFSMGHHETIGFRSGYAGTFFWYDLMADEKTDLLIVPFQVMDVTLKKYMALSPEEALKECKLLIDRVYSVKGLFSLIWHNSSFYETESWIHWDKVYFELLKYAADRHK